MPSQAGERTEYDYLRTEWSVSYGFGYVISFADHDALRVDESPQEPTPNSIPRTVVSLSEVTEMDSGAGPAGRPYASRLQYTVRLEVARAVANALDLDFRWSQIV